jgi:hypothetical protein
LLYGFLTGIALRKEFINKLKTNFSINLINLNKKENEKVFS